MVYSVLYLSLKSQYDGKKHSHFRKYLFIGTEGRAQTRNPQLGRIFYYA